MTYNYATSIVFTLLLSLSAAHTLAAQPENCGQLSADNLERAQGLMAKVYPHDCCDNTLAACLSKEAPSHLVMRLANDLCRRVAEKQKDPEILREFDRRGSSMLGSGKPATIDLAGASWAGDEKAPVSVVVYSCARCPFCSKSVPQMYLAVTKGTLKGKARLAIRPFPVKSHEYSKEGGLAMQAADNLGRSWPYLLKLYEQFDMFCVGRLADLAEESGIDRAAFEAEMKKSSTAKRLVAAKKEGLRNQVVATPTYFISGKLYNGDMKTIALVDAIEEEHDRISGKLCKPNP
jgi:predicted DsbA family dithiol-disulfide isomerase